MKKFYKSLLFFFKVMNSFAMQKYTEKENVTQTVNKEERETKIYKVTFNDRTYRYYHDDNLLIQKEKITENQFLLIHKLLYKRIQYLIKDEFNIICTWGREFGKFFEVKEEQSRISNIERKKKINEIKSLEKEINELDSEINELDLKNKNFNKKCIDGDLVVYNSILNKIKANEKKKNLMFFLKI